MSGRFITSPVQEDANDSQEKKYSILLNELRFVADVFIQGAHNPPYLENFNRIVRERAKERLRAIYPEVYEEHAKIMRYAIHETEYDDFLPKEILHKMINDVDELFKLFAAQIEKKERETTKVFQANFEGLRLSEKIMNLIPSNHEQREYIYELCVKWIIKIETNIDIIDRIRCYGFMKKNINSGDLKEKNESMLPQALIYRSNINTHINRFVDRTIDKIFSRSISGINQKVNKLVISFILSTIFGATVVGIGGFVINLVELPFNMNVNVVEFAVTPAINFLKKTLNIGNQDICIYLLQEAISQTDELNEKLEKQIKAIAGYTFGDKRQMVLLKDLSRQIDELMSRKAKLSNVRVNIETIAPAMAVKESDGDLEGWTQFRDMAEGIDAKPFEDDDEFTVLSLKPGYKPVENVRKDSMECIDVDDFDGSEFEKKGEIEGEMEMESYVPPNTRAGSRILKPSDPTIFEKKQIIHFIEDEMSDNSTKEDKRNISNDKEDDESPKNLLKPPPILSKPPQKPAQPPQRTRKEDLEKPIISSQPQQPAKSDTLAPPPRLIKPPPPLPPKQPPTSIPTQSPLAAETLQTRTNQNPLADSVLMESCVEHDS